MTLTLKKRIELTEKLEPLYQRHGRAIAADNVPFFDELPPDEQDSVKKILKKFRAGSHTPESLLAEYEKWSGTSGIPPAQLAAFDKPAPALAKAPRAAAPEPPAVESKGGPQRVANPQAAFFSRIAALDKAEAAAKEQAARSSARGERGAFVTSEAERHQTTDDFAEGRAKKKPAAKSETVEARGKNKPETKAKHKAETKGRVQGKGDFAEARSKSEPKGKIDSSSAGPRSKGKAGGKSPIKPGKPSTSAYATKHEAKVEKKQNKSVQKRQKNALEAALIAALRENREFSDYKNVFLAARSKKRRLIAYLGPTNSGKTHSAMEALAAADSGAYLGPLRLMALENFDRLREKNIKAGLLTGEERLELDTATHICQTIETADFNRSYDVAVIDEVQLLTDKDRGGYWLNAIFGIAADVIYLCGAPIIENILRDLLELTGEELEVIYTERKSPLVFAESREDHLKLPAPGTAFIAFSRKNVLLWKELLESAGARVSVVYGALSPEVRKEQSRRFREGETDYLVATDAVGMGLNLPIQKILFTEVEKFDGEGFRSLLPHEVKQIGGRAGRFGMAAEAGVITSYVAKDLGYLKQSYFANEKELNLPDVHMKPTAAHIRKICESFNDFSFAFALQKFQKIGHEIFSVDISEEELTVAEKLDRIFGVEADSLGTRWFFGIAPADPKNEDVFDFYLDLAIQYKKVLQQTKQTVDLSVVEDPFARLEYAETQRKNLTLYLWFANKKADIFHEKDRAHDLAAYYDDAINKLLSQTAKAKKKKTSGLVLTFCTQCKAMLPPFSPYDVCRDCHAQRSR